MAGKRPALKLVAKNKQTGEVTPIGAAWLGDDGRLQGLHLEDGGAICIGETVIKGGSREQKFADATHYLNIYINEPLSPPDWLKSDATPPSAPPDAFSDNSDDIPF